MDEAAVAAELQLRPMDEAAVAAELQLRPMVEMAKARVFGEEGKRWP